MTQCARWSDPIDADLHAWGLCRCALYASGRGLGSFGTENPIIVRVNTASIVLLHYMGSR